MQAHDLPLDLLRNTRYFHTSVDQPGHQRKLPATLYSRR
jgi:hypothetical protein